MSKFSLIGYSSTSSFDSIAQDKESVGNQLDRLNQVIQSLASEKYSTDGSRFLYSPSIDSLHDPSKTFEDFYEDDNLYKGIEDILLELDRSFMITEDFRSMEIRRSQKNEILNEFCDVKIHVSLKELQNMIFSLKKLAENENLENAEIFVGNKKLVFCMNRDTFKVGKNTISELMALEINMEKYYDQEINKNQPDIDKYSEKYEEKYLEYDKNQLNHHKKQKNYDNIQEIFCYKEKHDYNDIFELNRENFVPQSEIHLLSKQKSEQEKLKQKLEWRLFEVNSLKEVHQKKLEKLSESEKQLFERKNELKTDEIRIQTQQFLIAKDYENIYQQKNILEKIREENRSRSQIIKTMMAKAATLCNVKNTLIVNTNKPKEFFEKKTSIYKKHPEIDAEMLGIDKEIEKLQELLKTDSNNSESIQTKIDRLKTQQSNIKTMRVINASVERSTILASKLKHFQRKKPQTLIKSSEKVFQNSENSFKNSENALRNSTNIQKLQNIKNPFEPLSSIDNNLKEFQTYIKIKENSLSDKEKDLNIRENMILNSINQVSGNVNSAVLIQNEQRSLSVLRKNIERNQRVVEDEILHNAKKTAEINRKEQEINKAIEIFNNFINEQTELENKLEILFNFLESSGSDYTKFKILP